MGFFSKSEPKEEKPQETSEEEKANQKLLYHTASARFGPVGRRDRTWTES